MCVCVCLHLIPACTIIPVGICVCMNMCSCVFSSACSSSGRLKQKTKHLLSNELELPRENEPLPCATHILNNQLPHITGRRSFSHTHTHQARVLSNKVACRLIQQFYFISLFHSINKYIDNKANSGEWRAIESAHTHFPTLFKGTMK